MPIPAPHVHVALKIAQPDGSVPSVQIDAAFFRHVNGNVYAPVVAAEVEVDYVLGKTHFQLHGVATLMVENLNLARTNLPAFGSHASFNRVLIPGVHPNISVRGFHSQLGFAFDNESFRPLLSPSR